MKIFVMCNWIKETLVNISVADRVKLFHSFTSWLEKHHAGNKCISIYGDLIGESVITIWDASIDECMGINLDCPVAQHLTITYLPIVDFDIMLKQINDAMSKNP